MLIDERSEWNSMRRRSKTIYRFEAREMLEYCKKGHCGAKDNNDENGFLYASTAVNKNKGGGKKDKENYQAYYEKSRGIRIERYGIVRRNAQKISGNPAFAKRQQLNAAY